MGGALALALSASGQTIDRLIYRSRGRVAALADRLSPRPDLISIENIAEIDSDILIIATQDENIPKVVGKLAKRFRGSTVFHTSGSMSSDSLQPFAKQGYKVASLHPLASITKWDDGLKRFDGAYFCIEGSENAVRTGKRLIKALGSKSFVIAGADKPLYHAAAVAAAGHVTALFDVAISLMVESGLSRNDARRVLWPLLSGVAANLEKTDTPRALTGTYARGDLATEKRHLAALKEKASPREMQVFVDLALRSLELSELAGLEPSLAAKMRRILTMAKGSGR